MNELSKIIPEIFYDILGRLIPGIIALILWPHALDLDWVKTIVAFYSGSTVLSGSFFVLGMTVVVVAYVIGHLISPLSATAHSHLLSKLFPACFRVLKDAVTRGKNPYPLKISHFFQAEASGILGNGVRQPSAAAYRRVTFLWYDWIRLNNPAAGTRLAKMRAEYRMLEGLYIVFGITVLLSGVSFIWRWFGCDSNLPLKICNIDTPHPAFIVTNILAFLIATWGAARMFQTFQFSVINHYYYIKSIDLLEENTNIPNIKGSEVTEDFLIINFSDGRSISVPLTWFPRLLQASPEERNNWRCSSDGLSIHWEDIGENISVEGLLSGEPSKAQVPFKQ